MLRCRVLRAGLLCGCGIQLAGIRTHCPLGSICTHSVFQLVYSNPLSPTCIHSVIQRACIHTPSVVQLVSSHPLSPSCIHSVIQRASIHTHSVVQLVCIRTHSVVQQGEFNSESVRLISEKLNIPRNFFFIASPAANFSVKLASLGGLVRAPSCSWLLTFVCCAGCRLITH
jgi:hypothetical protein